jgi:endonuclease YncB( thermonuclease family)
MHDNNVTLVIDPMSQTTDKYGRHLALVYRGRKTADEIKKIGEGSLNLELVINGLAVPYNKKYEKIPEYKTALIVAQKLNRGMWSDQEDQEKEKEPKK